MDFQKLASEVASREGKKSQVGIGNIREIISILSEIMAEDKSVVEMLLENGRKKDKENLKEPQ